MGGIILVIEYMLGLGFFFVVFIVRGFLLDRVYRGFKERVRLFCNVL